MDRGDAAYSDEAAALRSEMHKGITGQHGETGQLAGQRRQEGSKRAYHRSAEARDRPVVGMEWVQMQNAREARHLHENQRGADGGRRP